jgi:eukaryotic-like serine/threonine-protein kinase
MERQLARYAEALEEDLSAGREKVGAKAREGIKYERLFTEASNLLVEHLKGKPECRDLMAELEAPASDQLTSGASPGPSRAARAAS